MTWKEIGLALGYKKSPISSAHAIYERAVRKLRKNPEFRRLAIRCGFRSLSVIVLFFTICIGTPSQTSSSPVFDYVVTTVDVNGFESAFSSQVVATFGQGQHIATLTWTASVVPAGGAAVKGYNVYRGTVSGGPYTKINAVPVTGVTYVDTFVLPNAPSGLAAT